MDAPSAIHQRPANAAAVVVTSAATAAASPHAGGGGLSVRRGMAVRRNPRANANRNPWICTRPCARHEYAPIQPAQ